MSMAVDSQHGGRFLEDKMIIWDCGEISVVRLPGFGSSFFQQGQSSPADPRLVSTISTSGFKMA